MFCDVTYWAGVDVSLEKLVCTGLKKWGGFIQRYLLVEDRHDTHHLGPANRFCETSLSTPCQLGFRATSYLAHVGDEVR